MSRSRRAIAVATALALVTGGGVASAQQTSQIPPDAAPQRKITPPKLVKFVEAEFPPSEVAAGKGAAVVLQIAIDATGVVVEVKVSESAGPAFDAAAVAAAKQFVFEPAKVEGTAIPVKIGYRYVFTFVEKIVKKTTADFQGTVRDRRTKQVLPNVRVAVDTGQQTITDEDGRFQILDVPVGEHTVTLSGENLATVGTTETFEVAKRIDATYEVEPKKEKSGNPDEEEEIVVTAPRIKKQIVSTQVAAEQATRVPGTQGDVLKVVENLPGVARAAAGSGALVVWGSSPQDTRVYVDGIHVPRLYHDGGYRSIVSSDFVKSVELIPGGYGAEYGRGLGGLVTVALKPLDEEGIHGSVAADTIDASASVRAKVSDHLHVAIAARKSYLDSVLAAVTSENVGEYVPIPSYWDGQARVVYDFGSHETLELGGLVSSDLTTRTLLNSDPALTTSQTTGTDFNRVYLRYQKHMADGSLVEVTPSFGTNSTSLDQPLRLHTHGSDELLGRLRVASELARPGAAVPARDRRTRRRGHLVEPASTRVHRRATARGRHLRVRRAAAAADQRRRLADRDRLGRVLRGRRLLVSGGQAAHRPWRALRALRLDDEQDAAARGQQPRRGVHARRRGDRAAHRGALRHDSARGLEGRLRPLSPVPSGRGPLGACSATHPGAFERRGTISRAATSS